VGKKTIYGPYKLTRDQKEGWLSECSCDVGIWHGAQRALHIMRQGYNMTFLLPDVKVFPEHRLSMNQPTANIVLVELNWHLHVDVGRNVGVKRCLAQPDDSSDKKKPDNHGV
jgi:hypothetical protein